MLTIVVAVVSFLAGAGLTFFFLRNSPKTAVKINQAVNQATGQNK